MDIIRKWHAPDILVVNGDAIEGRQDKQGGAELITNDRNVQSDMAVEAIRLWHAKKIFMTYGSAYHTGSAEDFEYNIAKELKAKIEGHLFLEIGGMTFDIRHKVGSSSIPHGRATSLMREMAWNLIRYAEEDEPKASVIVRSHVHYHVWVEQPGRVMFTTPALQLSRGRYGSRECSGETHWGAIRLIVDRGNIIRRDLCIKKLASNLPMTFRVR